MGSDSREGERDTARRRVNRLAIVLCVLLGAGGVGFALTTGGLLGWLFAGFLLLGGRFWLRPGRRDGRTLAKTVAGLVAGIGLLFAAMVATWETAEVIVLRHLDERGESYGERLWVIDLRGRPSFVTSSSARRVALLQRYPEVELVRGGRTECRRAAILGLDDDPGEETRRLYQELGEEARRLYEQKYGFRIQLASKLVGYLLGGRSEEGLVLVRLEPCDS